MKKRITAFLMVLSLTAALSVTAMAAGEQTYEGDDSQTFSGEATIDVGASYKEVAVDGGEVYSVTLQWDDIADLVYTSASAGTYVWDTEEHVYVLEEGSSDSGAWSTTSTEITINVTNDSNADITVSGTYEDAEDSVTTEADDGSFAAIILETAAQSNGVIIPYTDTTTNGEAQSGELTGTVSVTDGTISADTTIGTLTVTVAAND